MRFNILCDADWEARIDKVLDFYSKLGYRRFFEVRSYGNSLEGVTIILMCQNPNLNLKQRIRYSKKEKKIYIDLMLDLLQMKSIDQQQRNNIVTKKILTEVTPIISKYKLDDFDLKKFEADLIEIFNNY